MQKQFGIEISLLQDGDRIILSLIIVSCEDGGGGFGEWFCLRTLCKCGLGTSDVQNLYQRINLFAQLDKIIVHRSGVVNSLNHYTHLNNKRT